MMEANLRPLLQAGTVTFPTNNEQGGTAIDLVWGNEETENLIVKCHTIEANNDHASDHLPIEIILNTCPKTVPPAPPYNFEKTNWDLLKIHLRKSMPPIIGTHPSPTELDTYGENFTNALQDAITKTTPRKKPCPHSKRWWTSDLTDLRKAVNNARNKYHRTTNGVDAMEWRLYRARYKEEIRMAKDRKWRQFVQEADEKTIWMVKKYIDKPPSPYSIPTINQATSNEGKAHKFTLTFFPPPPPANTDDITTATYPTPVTCYQKITPYQIQRALDKLSLKKAPGPD